MALEGEAIAGRRLEPPRRRNLNFREEVRPLVDITGVRAIGVETAAVAVVDDVGCDEKSHGCTEATAPSRSRLCVRSARRMGKERKRNRRGQMQPARWKPA